MAATMKVFPTTRTERQIQRLGIGPWALTPAAVDLFARRHRLRLWLLWGVAVPGAMAIFVTTWNSDVAPRSNSSTSTLEAYGIHTGWTAALFGGAVLVGTELVRLLDRWVARDLGVRITRVARVPVSTILGRFRSSYFAGLVVVNAAIAIALFRVGQADLHAYRWGFVIAFALCTACSALGVLREAWRPTIAVDPISLVIDERMRSQDAFASLQPFAYLDVLTGFAFGATGRSGTLDEVVAFAPVVALAFWALASSYSPWPKPKPAPWLAHPVRPDA